MRKKKTVEPPERGEYTLWHPKEWTTVWRIESVNSKLERVFFECGGYTTVAPGFVEEGDTVRVRRTRLEIQ